MPSTKPSTPGNDREALRLLSDSGNGGTITLEPTPTRETIKKRLATQVLEGFRPCLEAETAFAMTIHKSQGAEFDRVLMVLPIDETQLLTRELIYTGITEHGEHSRSGATSSFSAQQ